MSASAWKPVPGALPVRCGKCGAAYQTWASVAAQEGVGPQHVPADPDDAADPDPYVLWLFNCGCRTTLAVRVVAAP